MEKIHKTIITCIIITQNNAQYHFNMIVFQVKYACYQDLTREYPHHGVSNHELTQIFYDGLGPKDRYLLDVASRGTFMSKFEDEAMELMETVLENSHHDRTNHSEKAQRQKED